MNYCKPNSWVIASRFLFLTIFLTACFSSEDNQPSSRPGEPSTAEGRPAVEVTWSQHCDNAAFPSIAWTQCELENVAFTLQAPLEQLLNPDFLTRASLQSGANIGSYLQRVIEDPSWLLLSLRTLSLNLNTPVTSVTSTYAGPAVSDPYRFPEAEGPDGIPFYNDEAVVTPVVFFDEQCARLSGRIWRPRQTANPLPGIVINNGSVQAHEPAYWWAAQALVRSGYQVLTFDPRGQGRSDFTTPQGGTGTNIDPSVFWTGLVDAIDFFRSSPERPAPHTAKCQSAYPATQITAFNPEHRALDLNRLGLAGHSLGAIGVSVVQGYGAPGAEPWPGRLDQENPVDVIVAWDGLVQPGGGLVGGAFQGGGLGDVLDRTGLTDPIFRAVVQRGLPQFGIRVPAMSQGSDYGVIVSPFLAPPDPEQRLALGFRPWQKSGQPVVDITLRGSTHFEWSQLVGLPASSWCADTSSGRCENGWAIRTIERNTVAWFDRWLKAPGEMGFDDADERLLDDNGDLGADRLSYRYHSARAFPLRNGLNAECESIRAGCPAIK